MTKISKIKGLTKTQISKVSGISLSSIKKIKSVRLEQGFSTYSIAFDGSSDYASVGATGTGTELFPATVSDFTISFWIRFDSALTGFGYRGLFNRRNSNVDFIAFFYFMHNGTVFIQKKINNVVKFSRSSTGLLDLDPGEWYHIAIVNDVDGGTSGLKFYRNGSFFSSLGALDNDDGTMEDGNLNNKLEIGRFANGILYTVASEIDDLAIHHAALSEDNINAMWNNGEPIDLTSDSGNYDTSSDLAYYWKFENNGTETVNNTTNSVTLFNDASYSSANPPGS